MNHPVGEAYIVLISGISVEVLLWQDRRLAREGEAKFGQWLRSLEVYQNGID